MAEGNYYITDNTKRAKIYGAQSLEETECKFKVDIKMKENGKIAWTTLGELVKAFGCNISEAILNSDTISKMVEQQKKEKSHLLEASKNLKLEDFQVVKKLGEGQFGHVFLVTDKTKENFYALKSISKEETIKTRL